MQSQGLTPIVIVEVHNRVLKVESRVEMKSSKSENLWYTEKHHMEKNLQGVDDPGAGSVFQVFLPLAREMVLSAGR